MLGGAGPGGPGGGENPGPAAYERAAEALLRLLEVIGPGSHHLVCSASVPGAPLVAALRIERGAGGKLLMAEAQAVAVCGVLAAALDTGAPGGLVLRSRPAPPAAHDGAGEEMVRGWSVQRGWLRPLTEAEVFAAYCTDAETGEPVPPEPGVEHRAGIELPVPGGDGPPDEQPPGTR